MTCELEHQNCLIFKDFVDCDFENLIHEEIMSFRSGLLWIGKPFSDFDIMNLSGSRFLKPKKVIKEKKNLLFSKIKHASLESKI